MCWGRQGAGRGAGLQQPKRHASCTVQSRGRVGEEASVVRCLSLCAHRSLPPAAQVLCGAILGVVVGLLYPTPPPMPLP